MGVDKYDSENVANMFEQLEKRIRTYNNDYGEGGGRAFIQRYEKQPEKATWETSNQPLVFVICTLMMPHIHKLVRQAGELDFKSRPLQLPHICDEHMHISWKRSIGCGVRVKRSVQRQ